MEQSGKCVKIGELFHKTLSLTETDGPHNEEVNCKCMPGAKALNKIKHLPINLCSVLQNKINCYIMI